MNQVILFVLILNLLNTRQVLQEIIIILVLVNLVMLQTMLVKNETEIVVPLKHLSTFWRTLNIALINCEIELILTWSKNCALADMTVRAAGGSIAGGSLLFNNDPPAIIALTGLEFQTQSCMFQLLHCQEKMTKNF